jgi:cytochrome d oxidase subunit CydB
MHTFVPFWFIIIAILWTGLFILEGFDFGVGLLHDAVGTGDAERRAAINTIGPLWDGNEVWLIVAAAAMFAAFPGWYATMFSGIYLLLVLLLCRTDHPRRGVRVPRQEGRGQLAPHLGRAADRRQRPGPAAVRRRAG